MDNDTTGVSDATVLLDLAGLSVESVERAVDGSRLVRLVTADEAAAACPTCGVFAFRVKEYVHTSPRDLLCGGGRLLLVWRKRRWYCYEQLCPRASFTESVPAVPARARITTRLRAHAGDLVVDGLAATVAAAGRSTGLSWPTVMDAVRVQADSLVDQAPDPVEVLGIDEVRRGRPKWRPVEKAPEPVATESVAPGPVAAEPDEGEPVAGETEPVVETAKARVLADRQVYGYAEQGAAIGRLKGRKTLHPLIATVSTPIAAPVVAGIRLRKGKSADVRGAARFLAETLAVVRRITPTARIVVRADSKFYSTAVAAAAARYHASVSLTTGSNPSITTTISTIEENLPCSNRSGSSSTLRSVKTASSLRSYGRVARRFLDDVGVSDDVVAQDDVVLVGVTAAAVTGFMRGQCQGRGHASAKATATALRSLLVTSTCTDTPRRR